MLKSWLHRAIALVALGVVAYLFWPLLKEIRAAARLFASAHWGWLAAAVLLQLGSYSSLTWLNVLAMRPFPGRIGFWRLMCVLTAMAFITSAVPSAGASGVVLRARLLARYGYTARGFHLQPAAADTLHGGRHGGGLPVRPGLPSADGTGDRGGDRAAGRPGPAHGLPAVVRLAPGLQPSPGPGPAGEAGRLLEPAGLPLRLAAPAPRRAGGAPGSLPPGPAGAGQRAPLEVPGRHRRADSAGRGQPGRLLSRPSATSSARISCCSATAFSW